ncbi:MAG: DUF1080 domain-containing protein [Imperialibacter sp.]|uniref:3-keto-disaccharide hydrolase n=1 Tax=Imperialibacter sp. TaxID=2038411 RepID=UPI0032ED8C5F
MNKLSKFALSLLSLVLFVAIDTAYAQEANPLEGRWNLTITKDGAELPSWLEIQHSGYHTLVGRFCYASGSARPIAEVKAKDGKFNFAIPVQWEPGEGDMAFEGQLIGDQLKGTMLFTDGKKYNWVGTRAPKLAYVDNPEWGEPITLFNGRDLSGWHAMGENQWKVESGVLTSEKSGANMVSDQKFNDFKLHLEFRYPKGSNSGVYLRGRYEVQIVDSKGMEPSSGLLGGIYGLISPNEMVAKDAGVWQSYDITLIGRRVTVVLNGKTIISDQTIVGMTGGALDNNEAEPGPLMFQGDHGAIEFRNIIIAPRVEEKKSK